MRLLAFFLAFCFAANAASATCTVPSFVPYNFTLPVTGNYPNQQPDFNAADGFTLNALGQAVFTEYQGQDLNMNTWGTCAQGQINALSNNISGLFGATDGTARLMVALPNGKHFFLTGTFSQ